MAEPKLNGLRGRETATQEAERERHSPADLKADREQDKQNSIRPSKRAKSANPKATQPEWEPGKRQPEGKKPRDRAREIPEDVRKRFTQVGNQFFFPDGTRAFTDR